MDKGELLILFHVFIELLVFALPFVFIFVGSISHYIDGTYCYFRKTDSEETYPAFESIGIVTSCEELTGKSICITWVSNDFSLLVIKKIFKKLFIRL